MDQPIVTYAIIGLNVLFSLQGFKNSSLFERYKFQVDAILNRKQYERMFTSGFLHANMQHLLFNMMTLFFFGPIVEMMLGPVNMVLVYVGSLIGGSLISLYIKRNKGYYSAIGASGAVSGILYGAILYDPMMLINFIIPAFLFAIGYTAYTIYGMFKNKGNIGHEAHLGGALFGVILTVAFDMRLLREHLWLILVVVIPSIIFILILANRDVTEISSLFNKKKDFSIDDAFNSRRVNDQKEMDRILEKVKGRGLNSLSQKERQFLDDRRK